jgi:hypothetical protein
MLLWRHFNSYPRNFRYQPISLSISKQAPTPDYKRNGDLIKAISHNIYAAIIPAIKFGEGRVILKMG